MTNEQGDFVWYELMTTDAGKAQNFYMQVVGWTFTDSGMPQMDYRILSTKEGPVAGLLALNAEMIAGGARSAWIGYVAVNDVDTTLAASLAAGGQVLMPATDIPNVGRVAMIADPQGATLYLMKRADTETASHSFAAQSPIVGHCAWNELTTTDPAAAIRFYTDQFGWRQEGDMDMGPMGKYQFMWQRDFMIAGVMASPPDLPGPYWSHYFRVADIDEAAKTITAQGGQIMRGPDEIPGGEFSINALDPQGTAFALVGKRKAGAG